MISIGFHSGARIRSVLFQLLRQCNYQCSHCSQAAPHVGHESIEPLPLEAVKLRLGRLKTFGLQRVRFTGGEPLLHPNLLQIIDYAKSCDLDTSIITNGARLRACARDLGEAGIDSVWISLYGSNDHAYAAVAQRNAPSHALCEAVETLVSNGVRVGVYCSISLSETDLDFSLLDRVVSRGVTHVKFMQLMEQGRLLDSEKHDFATLCKSSLEQVIAYRLRRPSVKISLSMRSGQLHEFLEAGFHVPVDLGCSAGSLDSWSVSVDGALKPCCLMMPSSTPDAANGRSAPTKPLRFFPSAERFVNQSSDANAACPALPHYGPHPSEEFICPLVYASA